jgi:hypothetical protein
MVIPLPIVIPEPMLIGDGAEVVMLLLAALALLVPTLLVAVTVNV